MTRLSISVVFVSVEYDLPYDGIATGSPNAVLVNRIIKCIYAVILADKIIRCIYLRSCVFMSRFRRDLNPIRDG